jgi:hypothetical protein
MRPNDPAPVLAAADPMRVAAARLLAEAHVRLMRRAFALTQSVSDTPGSALKIEGFWASMEIHAAWLRGEPITAKDLHALCAGLISAPTLSRALRESARQGWITAVASSADRRVKHLLPTAKAISLLLARAPEGAAVLRELVADHALPDR